MKTLFICTVLLACSLSLSAAEATLSHITVSGGHHDLGVAITATAPITPRVATVTGPDRLIVDLPGVSPRVGLEKMLVNRGTLRDIRVGLLSTKPLITRVVLDLLAPIEYRLLPSQNALVIGLGNEKEADPAPAPAPIGVTTKLPVETRAAETIPAVVALPPAPFSPERSRARWILPILTMGTVFAMLVIALVNHIQNRRMRRGV
jgi:hypothetical protein